MGEPKPWSDDRIFQTVYFTNVYRENDKVTKWIRERFTVEEFGPNLEMAMVAARIFNHPPSLQFFMDRLNPLDPDNLLADLRYLQEDKKQIWGGAYLITTHGQKMTKIDYCVRLLQEADEKLPITKIGDYPLCESYHRTIMGIDGMGSFLAAQVVADLKNTPRHPLYYAEDKDTFSAPGPGSLRGLTWFHGIQVTPSNYDVMIRAAAEYLEWNGDMQDLQNCFCEFDKYCRVSKGTGRSKRKYPGTE